MTQPNSSDSAPLGAPHSAEYPIRPVLAVVGAGSLVWGRSIVVDLMNNPDLEGAEIRLIDVLPERMEMVREWVEFARIALGGSHVITAHTNLREGLRGATGCLTAISVGGDRLWRYDAMYPQLDGIFQPVGDTTGPGGAMRALRHAPALLHIARTLAEVGAPDAVLLQVTNPLNPLTACLDTQPGIRVVGFCHGYEDTEHIIAETLGLVPEGMSKAVWKNHCVPVNVEVAGNNHFVFVDKLTIGDRHYDQSTLHELTPAIFDCPFREAIWSRFGVLVGNNPRHPIEFLPDFLTKKWGYGRAWGVSLVANEIDPEKGERHDERQPRMEADLRAARADPSVVRSWPLEHSHEPIAEILAALHTGNRFDAHLNVRNEGAIRGVEDDAHVELFCRIENGVVHRPQVVFPDGITAEISRIARSHLLLARCCMAFDEELLMEALSLDALIPSDKGLARRLMREMIEFQKDYIFPAGVAGES